jgi:hypothetical protein
MNSAPARRVGLRRILPNHGDKSPSHSFKTSAKGANGFWPNYRQYFPLPFADRRRAELFTITEASVNVSEVTLRQPLIPPDFAPPAPLRRHAPDGSLR